MNPSCGPSCKLAHAHAACANGNGSAAHAQPDASVFCVVPSDSVQRFMARVPKAELHIHLEGTLEPEMMMELAARNGMPAPYPDADAARKAYNFTDLQSFLDLYYNGCAVLRTQQDFYDLAWAYFTKAAADNTKHVELFFDPQTHLERSVPFSVFFPGILAAVRDAKARLGLDVALIMCFLRHLSEESAHETLTQAAPFKEHLLGVGLDSSEADRPPALFKRVYAVAREMGLRVVAHAGEEGPAAYVWEALQELKVERVDHGIHCLDDPSLVAHLEKTRIGLTLCPLSNLRLKVFATEEEAATVLRRFILETEMVVTINSDDPAYFGGYLLDNYRFVQRLLGLDVAQIARLARNGFEASFISDAERAGYLAAIDEEVQAALKL